MECEPTLEKVRESLTKEETLKLRQKDKMPIKRQSVSGRGISKGKSPVVKKLNVFDDLCMNGMSLYLSA